MKFVIQFVAHAMTKAWISALSSQSEADQHHDPIASLSRGPLLTVNYQL
jgi:hypothetical protein